VGKAPRYRDTEHQEGKNRWSGSAGSQRSPEWSGRRKIRWRTATPHHPSVGDPSRADWTSPGGLAGHQHPASDS